MPKNPVPHLSCESPKNEGQEEADWGVRLLMEMLSDKWRSPVLLVLLDGTIRYGQLNGRIPAVSHTMLTRTLQDLERGGLVEREAFASVPLRVEYTLTPLGHTLATKVRAMNEWALSHEADLRAIVLNFESAPHPNRPAK